MSERKRCRSVSSLMLIWWHRASIYQHCRLSCRSTRTQMVTRQGYSLEWLIPHWASKMRIQECISKINVFDKGEARTNLLTNMRNYQSQCHIWTRTIISTNTLPWWKAVNVRFFMWRELRVCCKPNCLALFSCERRSALTIVQSTLSLKCLCLGKRYTRPINLLLAKLYLLNCCYHPLQFEKQVSALFNEVVNDLRRADKNQPENNWFMRGSRCVFAKMLLQRMLLSNMFVTFSSTEFIVFKFRDCLWRTHKCCGVAF